MREVVNCINRSKKILVLSHKNPDGDALGSSLALSLSLKKKNKYIENYSINSFPGIFNFLPGKELFKNEISSKHFDLVVLLDCANFKRTGIENFKTLVPSFDTLLIIDHHPPIDTEKYNNEVVWIDENKSSTAVMIYELLVNMEIDIDKSIATCLLTGIFTDTGGFQHSNTDENTLRVAGELVKKGPRIEKISQNIFSKKNIPAIKLWGKALSRIETDPKTGMAISYIDSHDIDSLGAKKEDLDGLVSVINTVSDSDFSLLLTKTDDNKIKGSLRSEEYKGIDVSKIARSLGGGGHKLASGFEVEGEMRESIDRISKLVLSLRKKALEKERLNR